MSPGGGDGNPRAAARVVEVSLTGPLAVTVDGQPLMLPARRDVQLALALVFLHAPTPCRRDALAEALAPDAPRRDASARLRRALWRVGQLPCPPLLAADREHVSLNAGYQLSRDTEQLAAALAIAAPLGDSGARALEAALALQRGPLLDGLNAPGLDELRAEHRADVLTARRRLARFYHARQSLTKAQPLLKAILKDEPWDEASLAALMELTAQTGHRRAALALYADYAARLAEELGEPPGPRLTRLATSLEAAPPRGEGGAPAAMVGRDAPWAAAAKALRQASGGNGQIMLLQGEGGIGKTHLMEAVEDHAGWLGMRCLTSMGLEGSSAPFAALLPPLRDVLTIPVQEQLAAQLGPEPLAHLAPLLPQVGRGGQLPSPLHDPRAEALRLQGSLLACLCGLARLGPAALFIDDGHWLDADSLALLERLGEAAAGLPLVVIVTFRPGEARRQPPVWATLGALALLPNSQRITLTGLDVPSIQALVSAATGAPTAKGRAEELLRRTGGNPFYILELTKFDGRGRDAARGHSPQLTVHIQGRLAALPPDTRALAELCAVINPPIPFSFLSAMHGADAATIIDALRTLAIHGIVVERGDGYHIAHDLLREGILRALAPQRARQMHRAAAQHLQALTPPPYDQLAYHRSGAAQWHAAIDAHLTAATAARERFAVQTALSHIERAQALMEAHPAPAERRLQWRCRALLLRLPMEAQLGTLAQREEELALLNELGEAAIEPATHVEILMECSRLRSRSGADLGQAVELARRAVLIAEKADLTQGLACAWQTLAYAQLNAGALEDARQASAQAMDHWQNLGDASSPRGLEARLLHAQCLGRLGEVRASRRIAQAMLTDARREGDRYAIGRAHIWLATAASFLGDYTAAIAHGRAGLKEMEALGARLHQARVLGNLAVYHWDLGDLGAAIEHTRRSLKLFTSYGDQLAALTASINLASLYHRVGRSEEALERCLACLDACDELGSTENELRVRSGMVEMLCQLGRLDDAQAYLSQSQALAEPVEDVTVLAGLKLCEGDLHGARGQWEDAARCYDEAAQGLSEAQRLTYVAAARSFKALATLSLGDVGGALRDSDAAISLATAHGGGEYQAHIFYHRYRVLWAVGERDAALAMLSQAWASISETADTLHGQAWRDAFFAASPQREICEAMKRHAGRRERRRLKRLGQRAPKEGDVWVTVDWTVEAPEDRRFKDGPPRRRHRLMRLLRQASEQGAEASIAELAAALGVSRGTIKRDLSRLGKGWTQR